jgi:hypothetical protein
MIVAVGAFAALAQLEIAPAIVNGVFYAVLAVIAGSAIIAIGGGGIQPMRDRWERALTKVEQEAPQARQHMHARRTAARTPEPRPEPPPQPVEPEPVPATEVDHGQGEPEPTSVADVAEVEEVGDGPRETEQVPPPTPVPGRRSGGRREPLRSRSPRNSNGA